MSRYFSLGADHVAEFTVAGTMIDTKGHRYKNIKELAERVGFELEALCGRSSPQPKSRHDREHGQSGGEGGIGA
jgi:hypothetical protein